MPKDIEDLYFDAQDCSDAGDEPAAARLLERIVRTTVATESGRIVSSAAHNCLAEAQIDRAVALGFPMAAGRASEIAPVLEARRLLGRALKLWPQNAQAAMSLALLERDCGNAERALQLWSMVAALPSAPAAGLDGEWANAWILEPRSRCLPLAAMYAALLLSQLGRHPQAAPYLRRFGFTRALAPVVWAAARTPPPQHGGVSQGGVHSGAACPVRYFGSALRPQTHEQLLAAFAPGAAYWRETGYEQASANKQYFTFGVDVSALRNGARAPSNLAEAVVVQLLPLLGRDGDSLVSAEWWVHSRLAGRNVGHELHYDLEERLLEASVCNSGHTPSWTPQTTRTHAHARANTQGRARLTSRPPLWVPCAAGAGPRCSPDHLFGCLPDRRWRPNPRAGRDAGRRVSCVTRVAGAPPARRLHDLPWQSAPWRRPHQLPRRQHFHHLCRRLHHRLLRHFLHLLFRLDRRAAAASGAAPHSADRVVLGANTAQDDAQTARAAVGHAPLHPLADVARRVAAAARKKRRAAADRRAEATCRAGGLARLGGGAPSHARCRCRARRGAAGRWRRRRRRRHRSRSRSRSAAGGASIAAAALFPSDGRRRQGPPVRGAWYRRQLGRGGRDRAASQEESRRRSS